VSVVGNTYLIPLVKGRSDLLRIPKNLVNDLGIKNAFTTTALKPDGRKLPVQLNPVDRTLGGLCTWLKTRDDENIKSVRLIVLSEQPYTFSVEFSAEAPDLADDTDNIKFHRPDKGLYLGGRLLPEFYELLRTKETVAIDETDLLRQVFICGTNGSGKTVLAKIFIEESALKGIPVIAIDLKGDISSMAILFSGEEPAELIPWVMTQGDESREAKAASIAEQQKANLQRWGIQDKDVNDFKNKVSVNVFTPRSNAGFRLALSAFVEPPDDVEELKEKDPDSFENVIEFMAETFISRLNLTKKKAQKARGYIYEIIKTCWHQGESLRGYEGIKKVLDEVRLGELGIEQIGGMATDEYISQKDRQDISSAINTLLTGAQKLWFQGFPLDVEQLVNHKNYDGRTPITIINIKHLNFQDQAYVVGYVAYLIWFWMRRLPGVNIPRLIFYIDEIGGGGSKEAFFPPVANSPSKPALNQLLRQGRAFGVCCMFATQEPGDIAHKAFGECGTLAVGQLRSKRERQKIEQVASIAQLDFETAAKFLPNLNTGQFLIKTPSPSFPWTIFEERWLMHLHRVLSQVDIERIKENYEKEVRVLFEEAQKCRNEGKILSAKNILESIINNYCFSDLCVKAYLLLGKILYDMSDYDNAIKNFDDMIKRRMEAEEIGEAYFLLGKCKEQIELFTDAAKDFAKVKGSAAGEDIKAIAISHEQYCNNRSSWPELTQVHKFFWWILGRKPDDATLTRLQIKDKDLLEEQFKTILKEQDFSIPEPIDYQELIEASKKAAAEQFEKNVEQIKAERWATDQVPKIEEFLKQGALNEAFAQCKRVAQHLKDTGGYAVPSLISAFEKFNKCTEQKSNKLNKKLLMLEARQFEFEIANLFRHKGYKSFATSLSGDDGIDVFASNDDEKVIVQCKRWKHPVGRDKVDELAGVKNRYMTDRAILATTSTFSEDAKQAAHKNHIELWDFYRIKQEWQAVFSAK